MQKQNVIIIIIIVFAFFTKRSKWTNAN